MMNRGRRKSAGVGGKSTPNQVRLEYGENNVNVGPLKDIPEICVDHFYGDDLKSSVFFLTHAHTDHMVGLESPDFLERLECAGVTLYCHTLTPILLCAFSRYLGGQENLERLIRRRKIVPKDADVPFYVEIVRNRTSSTKVEEEETLSVTVTLLPAGHCPGSVMFLFETESLRILHTGDFRLTEEDLRRMTSLSTWTSKGGVPKRIDHLYVDTTFCTREASQFPGRKDVVLKALGHVRQWTGMNRSNWVFIKFAAKFAHEYILLELSKTFNNAKIHVTPERRDIYANIPGLCDVVTLDAQTPFHLCGNRRCLEDGESMELRLTSMWYTMLGASSNSDVVVRTSKRLNVCYSMHSSLEEIGRTIDYLRPSVVTPLVKPFQSSMEDVKEALREVCKVSFTFEDYRSGDWSHLSYAATSTMKEMDGRPVDVLLEESIEENDVEEEMDVLVSQSDDNNAQMGPLPSGTNKSDSQSSGSLPNSQEERLLELSPLPRLLMPQGLKNLLFSRKRKHDNVNDDDDDGNLLETSPVTLHYKSKRKLIVCDSDSSISDVDSVIGSQEQEPK